MKPLVLIAEDEPAQVEMLRYNLEASELNTIVATDGRSALLLLEEETPDLVVLDWMLPELSGIEVCRQIRQRRESKSLPIIMLTARGEVRGACAAARRESWRPAHWAKMV